MGIESTPSDDVSWCREHRTGLPPALASAGSPAAETPCAPSSCSGIELLRLCSSPGAFSFAPLPRLAVRAQSHRLDTETGWEHSLAQDTQTDRGTVPPSQPSAPGCAARWLLRGSSLGGWASREQLSHKPRAGYLILPESGGQEPGEATFTGCTWRVGQPVLCARPKACGHDFPGQQFSGTSSKSALGMDTGFPSHPHPFHLPDSFCPSSHLLLRFQTLMPFHYPYSFLVFPNSQIHFLTLTAPGKSFFLPFLILPEDARQ